jgi:hypothetical protein
MKDDLFLRFMMFAKRFDYSGHPVSKREGIRQHDPGPPLAAISSGWRECYNEDFKSEVRD